MVFCPIINLLSRFIILFDNFELMFEYFNSCSNVRKTIMSIFKTPSCIIEIHCGEITRIETHLHTIAIIEDLAFQREFYSNHKEVLIYHINIEAIAIECKDICVVKHLYKLSRHIFKRYSVLLNKLLG